MSHHRFISMLIGLGMLSACNDADERKLNAQNDNGADLSMHIDGGNGGAWIDATIGLPGLKLGTPSVDIDGVKLYPGARVNGIDVSGHAGDDEGGVVIHFDSDAAPDKIRDYYLAAFKEKGLKAAAEGQAMIGRDEDGKPFRIALTPQNDGTRGEIHVGQKDG